jgi:hypothetical protein
MNEIFDFCVQVLIELSELFGTTYKAINVWIFVIIWPIFTSILILIIILQRKTNRSLRNRRIYS